MCEQLLGGFAVKIRRVLLGALMFCAATHVWAQKVHVARDPGADFSKLKTYAWLESKHPAEGEWNQRVLDGVDARLAALGPCAGLPDLDF